MAEIRRSREAVRDGAEIWHYIAYDSPEAADRLLDLFNQKIKLLSESPGMGAMRDELAPSLRSFPVGSYLIFYRPIPSGIEVVRIIHGARNLKRIFKR
ncbi:MAG: parE1 3 4, toxin ParE1/3/4 [Phycisphaerales bacterium]|jgi:toxin ParE1/3/4|nr:parE1 3 4, toxin ParE1/3/4 [Phycisphaerales bacterium]